MPCLPSLGQLGRELIVGKVQPLTDLGVEFIYNDCQWSLAEVDGTHALLTHAYQGHAPARLWVGGAPAADRSPTQVMLGRHVAGSGVSAGLDTSPYYRINGPEVGYEHTGAVGDAFSGTIFDADGTPIGSGLWSYLAATNGTVSLAVEIFDQQPDDLFGGDESRTYHHISRYLADIVVKDIRWSVTP